MFANIRKISRLSESMSSRVLVEAVVLNEQGTITDTIADTTAAVDELGKKFDKEDAKVTIDAMDAVAEDPENIEAIEESVLSSFWDRIVKFFEGIIKFFQGIVQKIKDRLSLLTNDRKKFITEFDRQMKEKDKLKPAENFSWDGIKWNVSDNSILPVYEEAFEKISKKYDDALATISAIKAEAGMDESVITEKKVDHAEMKAQLAHDVMILSTDFDPVPVKKTLSDVSIKDMREWVEKSTDINKSIKENYEKQIKVLIDKKEEAEKKAREVSQNQPAAEKTKWMAIKDTVDGKSKLLGWISTNAKNVNDRITKEYMMALRKYVNSLKR